MFVAVKPGHSVGVIGESGCGKSTLARVLAGLLPAAAGEVDLHGTRLLADLKHRSKEDLRKIQFVFQMADTALNQRQTIGDILSRPLQFYQGMGRKQRKQRIGEILQMVELPEAFANRYPGELSGGQKQRVNLARALAADPEVVLCDEVTSALDAIVAANVIDLLKDLREKIGLSFVFISHDLSTVADFADEIVVLYAGRVVEQGLADRVMSPPFHPYTRLLIGSVPEMRAGWLEDVTKSREAQAGIARDVDLMAPGCPFYARCAVAIEGTCNSTVPPDRVVDAGHVILCHQPVDALV